MKRFMIEIPFDTMHSVFESNSISTGMTIEAPGGVRLEVLPGGVQKRSFGQVEAALFTIAVTLATDAGKKLFVDWLCEKIKKSRRPSIAINRHIVEKITPEGIERTIDEQIEMRK